MATPDSSDRPEKSDEEPSIWHYDQDFLRGRPASEFGVCFCRVPFSLYVNLERPVKVSFAFFLSLFYLFYPSRGGQISWGRNQEIDSGLFDGGGGALFARP